MSIKSFLIIVLMIIPVAAFSQPPENIYLGNIAKSGYENNASYGPFEIGFNFTFFGISYTQFYVSSNGLVTFGSGSSDGSEDPIPTAAAPNNFIGAFWDDLVIDGSGKILYNTIGASPNRRCIIQFSNMGFYTGPVLMGTFLVILNETSNNIQIQYRLIVDNSSQRSTGNSATIGIENSDGTSGLEYSYRTASMVSTGKAISFSPSGLNYSMNSDAIYEWLYLTTNISLPEPGIPTLLSPTQDAVIGSDFSFSWSDAGNAASYTLLISAYPDLGWATSYNAGTNLSYDVTGLALNQTYYWGVFATNATGTTWCEIKRFTTSSTPPLSAVPTTVWTEQSQDKTIKLNYTGGDASPKTAIITSLPAQGTLWQYNAGVKGTQINSVPTSVTDPNRNVIYTAPAASGNGIGNFNFKMNDAGGDSPEATITVNVSPPGIPSVLYIAKGAGVEIQFDRIMTDPTGKHNQFSVTVNGTPATITSAALKVGDRYSVTLELSPVLTGTETVTVAYTQGDVTSAAGGFLLSFTDQPVTLRSQTINFPQTLDKKYNESPFNLTATASSGLGLTYSSSNLAVATISSNVVTLKALGTSDITTRQAGNATWAPAKYVRTMTVAKGDQTITFPPITARTYGDADFTLSAVAGSLLLVTYTSSNTSVATVSGNTVHIVGAGTTTITASQAGNALWNAAPDVQQPLVVNKADQTITFAPIPAKVYGDADFTVAAGAGSLLLVTYTSSNSAVATITGNTVHIVGAGTATITASQAGDANWNPAPDVPQTLAVGKADQTITFAPIPAKVYGDTDFTLSAVASSGLLVAGSSSNTSVATVTGNTVHITGTGTTTITASQAGDTNYNPATDVAQTLTVNKGDQTITFGPLLDQTFGAPDFSLFGTASSGLTVSYVSSNPAVATVTGSTVHIVAVGSTTITASQPGDANYNAAADVPQTLNVYTANATITLGSLTATYDGLGHAATATTNPAGLTVLFTYDGSSTPPVDAGSYAVAASISDGSYHGSASGTMTISKANQTITFPPIPAKVYGDADFTLAAGAGSLFLVTGSSSNTSVATVTGNSIHIVGAGSTVITASQAGDGNWNAAPDVQQTLTVNKKDLSVTADNKTRAYGAADPAFTITYSGFVLGEDAAILDGLPTANCPTANSSSSPGTYPIEVSGGSDNNYDYNYTDGILTIVKADQTIAFPSITDRTYGDADFSLSALAGSGLLVSYTSSNTAVATVTGNTVHIVGAGSATITASQSGDANWNAAPDVQQTLTVNKKDLTVTADNKTRAYSSADPAFTITYSGFVLGEDAAILNGLPIANCQTANSSSSPGTYPIEVIGGSDNNYNYIYTDGVLTIVKADQTIAFPSISARTYGDADFALSALAGSGLLVSYTSSNTAVATVTGNTVHIVGTGSTTITATQSGDANWNAASDVQQTLTVNKKDLTVTADNKTRAYGASDPVYTITYSAFVSGETTSVLDVLPTANCPTANSTSSPGTYPIEVNGGSDNNYTYTYTNGVLTIVKADQTITFPSIGARTYGDADFALSALAGSGLLVSYTSSNTAVATVTGNTVHITGAGTAIITASQPGNSNYNAAPDVQQTLTVNKANQTITISATPARLLVGDSYTLAATSTSGLPVLFESPDPLLATISGDQLTGVSKGNVTIRAYNAGNSNYNQAEATVTIDIYSTHKDILNLFTPNGDGINDYWELPEMASWGNCNVRVYNRWGKLVYANKYYDNLWDGTSNGNPLPEGAYYFVIETENDGVKKGTLNIVR